MIVGIDLGTTNSLVAVFTEEGPVIIPNRLGKHLTPSVVSVDENGNVYVGETAQERRNLYPDSVAQAFKRSMGTDRTYDLSGKKFRPEELSSMILRYLKEDAEAYLGEEVTEAVISVPAYFDDKRRKATKRAGELAGLKVERMISEPTAAAVAYGLYEKEKDTRFLVFDLGGGTFDVSILELYHNILVKVICDVNNPLVGDEGCSTVFAPQKGADLQMVQRMEQAITRFADLFAKEYDRWLAGAGAAGGLGYAFAYFLHAELVHGIDLVLQEIHLEEAVRTADLVITGEGRMDAQTLMGKTPAGVARLAKKYAVPVIAYAGCFGDGIEQCTESGLFDRVYAVTEQEGAFDPQMAVRDLGQKVRETMSEWIHMIDTKKGANE